MVSSSPFKASFLGPRYWLTWVGVFFLYLISWLPHKFQLFLGKLIGRLVHRFMKRRRHIAEVNIRLCFPNMPEHEQRELVLKKHGKHRHSHDGNRHGLVVARVAN